MPGKVPFEEEILSPGGQVASALVACARLGLRAKYIGTVGDDERGRIQIESLQRHRHQPRSRAAPRNCPNQSAYIIIDRSTGERTVLWRRDDCLRIDPAEDHARTDRLRAPAAHRRARHAGGGARRRDRARATASRSPWTSTPSITASTACCPNVDYLVASSEFPAAWTGETDPFKALETIQNEYGMRVAAMTLGAHGALARENGTLPLRARFRRQLCGYHRRRETCFTGRSAMLFCRACRCARHSNFPMPWRP